MGAAETASKPENLTMELIIGLVASGIFTLLVCLALAWLYWGRALAPCPTGDCSQQAQASEQPPRPVAVAMPQPAAPAVPADAPPAGFGAHSWPLVLPTQAPVVALSEDTPAPPLPAPAPEVPMAAPDQQRVQDGAGVISPWSAVVVTRAIDAAKAVPVAAMRRSPMRMAPTAKPGQAPFPSGQTLTLRPCSGLLPLQPGLVCELTRNGSRWVISLLPLSRATGAAVIRACWSGLLLLQGGCVESRIEICPTNCPITIAEALAPLPIAIAHWSPRPW